MLSFPKGAKNLYYSHLSAEMPTPPLIKKKLKMKELKEKKKINIVYYLENSKKRELGNEIQK